MGIFKSSKMKKLQECILIWEKEEGKGEWAILAFDGVVREGHSGESIVTSFPIDSGFKVSDHTIRQNRLVELNTITSNVSMSVATQRKTFEETFNDLLILADAASSDYASATKYGRALYNNDKLSVGIPYTDIGFSTTNSLATALGAQVSISKLNETLDIIDRLNSSGKLVHVATMRGMRKNCVVRSYSAFNDVSNAYALPCTITLEQLNVVNLGRSRQATTPKDTDAEVVKQEQLAAKSVVPSSQNAEVKAFAVHSQVERVQSRQTVVEAKLLVPENFQDLEHKEIQYSTKTDTTFVYDGVEYTLGAVRYSNAMNCYVTSLQWRVDKEHKSILSLPLQSGTNLLRQYSTNMPSLVAINTADWGLDPDDSGALRLYIVQNFDEIFTGG